MRLVAYCKYKWLYFLPRKQNDQKGNNSGLSVRYQNQNVLVGDKSWLYICCNNAITEKWYDFSNLVSCIDHFIWKISWMTVSCVDNTKSICMFLRFRSSGKVLLRSIDTSLLFRSLVIPRIVLLINQVANSQKISAEFDDVSYFSLSWSI